MVDTTIVLISFAKSCRYSSCCWFIVAETTWTISATVKVEPGFVLVLNKFVLIDCLIMRGCLAGKPGRSPHTSHHASEASPYLNISVLDILGKFPSSTA